MISSKQESLDPMAEWLEADGLGGFASGTAGGIRTRRYHALLLTATAPPAGRMVLVNGLDAWVRTDDRIVPISSQRYVPEVIHPDGIARLTDFQAEPWPRWTYKIGEDLFVEHDFFRSARRFRLGFAMETAWKCRGIAPGATVSFGARLSCHSSREWVAEFFGGNCRRPRHLESLSGSPQGHGAQQRMVQVRAGLVSKLRLPGGTGEGVGFRGGFGFAGKLRI